MSDNANEPAYPNKFGDKGLTKREEFAKAAMQGLSSDIQQELDVNELARYSVAQADALLRALEHAT